MAEDRAEIAVGANADRDTRPAIRMYWRPRFLRAVLWGAFAAAVLGLLAYLAVPPLLKSLLEEEATRLLRRELRIERIDFNPYALSLRVGPLTLSDAGGREVAGFDELFVDLSLASLFKQALVVDEIRLRGPRLALIREADGRYDVSDLLDEWSQADDETEGATPRFSLNNIRIEDGRLSLEDRLKGRSHRLSGLTLGLPFVSSLPYQAEIFVEPVFTADIDAARIEAKARAKPFSHTRESELAFDLERFDLGVVQSYLPPGLPVRLASGLLDAELRLVFSQSPGQVSSLALSGAVHLSQLALEDRGGRPLLGWKRLDVELQRVDPLNLEVAIARMDIEAPEVNVTVDRQGNLNWLQAGLSPARPVAASAGSRPVPSPRWSLGALNLQGGVLRWRDDSNLPVVRGELRELQLRLGPLDHRLAAPLAIAELSFRPQFGEALRSGPVRLRDIHVDLAARRVEVGTMENTQMRILLRRERDGRLNWLQPPRLAMPPATEGSGPAPSARPWRARLARLAVDDLALRFEDRGGRRVRVQEIDALSLHGDNLGNEAGPPGQLTLKARVNRKGSLGIEGRVQAEPLDLALKLDARSLPLMPWQAYFDDYLDVAVTRGLVSAQGQAQVRERGGQWQADYRGSLTLGDFLAVDRVNHADFLKWKSLHLGAIDFRLQPLAIDIGEIALSDFYSRLILDAQGQLNLQRILRSPTEAAPAPAATPEGGQAVEKAPLPPIRIARVSLQNGNVHFSDHFIRPHYSVNVGKLGGRISGLSSAEGSLAELELRGAYANLAPVRVEGRLNPLANNPYLDLKAEVSGVDLVGFSPYAGKYAGYAIEKGKLSLNLAYKLENRQLSADNRLFLDQLTFGEAVDSPDATTLPVNLALALLRNNRGEIDINLPISGSLDDPQFSVGGLIVKVIVNLFVKAVSSPFALLGSLFGGDEALSTVDFAPGRNLLTPESEKKLAILAHALQERGGLKLEIVGRADPESDREGLKRVALERAVKVQKARELRRKTGEGRSLDALELGEDEYSTYLRLAYREAKFPKPRNLLGLEKSLPDEEMEKLLLTHLPAGEEALRQLATRRAETVQAWLAEKGAPLERLFMLPVKLGADPGGQRAAGVEFSLK